MGLLLLLTFIGLPLFELWLLVEIGSQIGGLNVIGLSLLTAAIGVTLVRMQGLSILKEMQSPQMQQSKPGETLIHGLFLLVAGLFLLFPGFLTDTVGAILLLPPVRLLLGRLGLAQMFARSGHSFHAHTHHKRPNQNWSQSTVIIDGEIIETTEEKPNHHDQKVIEGEVIDPNKH